MSSPSDASLASRAAFSSLRAWSLACAWSIRADASFGSGHWFEGGGLIRPVHLLRREGLKILLFQPRRYADTVSNLIPELFCLNETTSLAGQ